MNLLAWRLVLTASLFIGWLGYLGYLVATRPLTASGTSLVLSHPQFIASPFDIVAEISDPREPVVVEEILSPSNTPFAVGQKVKILDLDSCRPLPRRMGEEPPHDFTGPGRYLIPLRLSKREEGAYEVVPIPTSPGFNAKGMEDVGARPVRIYPYTEEAAAQYRRLTKP